MNFLITGGCGFIGSHLAEQLIRDSHHVAVIDNLSTGNIQNIRSLIDHPSFQYVIGDVAHRSAVNDLVENCDVIFHLAAAVGVRLIIEKPVQTIKNNVQGTETILEVAAKNQKKVILASTSEVYGKSTKIPFSEEDDLVLGPTFKGRWAYACSKALDEFLTIAYWKEKKLPVMVVRLFNTVGPRQTGRYGMVLPTFVRQALQKQSITIFGDGSQTRCFTHVQDVVRALIALAAEPRAIGEIFNIGSANEICIRDLAEMVKKMTSSSSSIITIPYEKAYESGFEDMAQRVPDLRKIQQWMGYQPKFDLQDMVRDVIEFVQNELK